MLYLQAWTESPAPSQININGNLHAGRDRPDKGARERLLQEDLAGPYQSQLARESLSKGRAKDEVNDDRQVRAKAILLGPVDDQQQSSATVAAEGAATNGSAICDDNGQQYNSKHKSSESSEQSKDTVASNVNTDHCVACTCWQSQEGTTAATTAATIRHLVQQRKRKFHYLIFYDTLRILDVNLINLFFLQSFVADFSKVPDPIYAVIPNTISNQPPVQANFANFDRENILNLSNSKSLSTCVSR